MPRTKQTARPRARPATPKKSLKEVRQTQAAVDKVKLAHAVEKLEKVKDEMPALLLKLNAEHAKLFDKYEEAAAPLRAFYRESNHVLDKLFGPVDNTRWSLIDDFKHYPPAAQQEMGTVIGNAPVSKLPSTVYWVRCRYDEEIPKHPCVLFPVERTAEKLDAMIDYIKRTSTSVDTAWKELIDAEKD
jgi:hypothetical protein